MMLFLLIIFAIFGYFLWKFAQLDHDLEILLALKFGKSISTIKGKVVWITGASSGIGEHLAYVLASNGAKLILSGRDESRLNKVAQTSCSIANYDEQNVLVLPFDIIDRHCHQQMMDKVLKHFNRLDILVNNAGRAQRSWFVDVDSEIDHQLFEINVFGLVNLTRIVLRYFLEHNPDGQFGVTSSTAGIVGSPFVSSYSASKHALHGYFESLRNELGSQQTTNNIGITLFCVGPTFSNVLYNAFTGKPGEIARQIQPPLSNRMTTERCAYLMAIALANRLDQVWITRQPTLLMHYVSQYLPQLFRKISPKYLSKKMLKHLRDLK